MTIDEAIKHAEEVAEEQENKFSISGEFLGNNADCKKCASEHRQLAEWLKELKYLRNLVAYSIDFHCTIEKAEKKTADCGR